MPLLDMTYSKVTGYSDLVRNEETKAIINTNMNDYNFYMSQKRLREQENKKIQNLEDDFSNIKKDIDEIKSLLRSLINESR